MYTVSKIQYYVHFITEALAVLSIPYMYYLSTKLPNPHKTFILIFMIGTLIIDGGLLLNWLTKLE